MIIRQRQRKFAAADSYSMFLSFTEADIKRAIKLYKGIVAKYLGKASIIKEQDIIYFFNHATFAMFDEKYQAELSEWALKLAIRHELIYPSSGIPQAYVFGDALEAKSESKKAIYEEK